jgi:hypothetical protein
LSRPRLTGPANPIQTAALIACAVAGAAVLTGVSPPTSIEQTLPPWQRVLWAAFMGGGALVALTGMYWWGGPFTGAAIKRTGLLAVSGGCSVYGGALLIVFGHTALVPGLQNVCIGVGCFLRAWQVNRALNEARTLALRIAAGGGGDVP